MSQQLLVKRASVVSLVAGVVVALLVDLVYRFPPNLAETGCSLLFVGVLVLLDLPLRSSTADMRKELMGLLYTPSTLRYIAERLLVVGVIISVLGVLVDFVGLAGVPFAVTGVIYIVIASLLLLGG